MEDGNAQIAASEKAGFNNLRRSGLKKSDTGDYFLQEVTESPVNKINKRIKNHGS